MKNIPPEIDALMWQLAEDGGPVAQAEFESRHARYGPELTRRIRMVAELRQAGKTMSHRPTFTPRPVRVQKTPQWAVAGVVGLAVIAVGAMAYVIASGAEHPKPVALGPVPHVDTSTPELPNQVVTAPSHEAPYQETPPVKAPVEEPRHETPTPESKPDSTPAYLKLRDVRVAETDLTTAISLVAAGGGLQVTIAPGFEDRKVTLDYRGLNTVDTLKAMGEEYGFSVLSEEDGHVLVVPARQKDPSDRRIGL